MKRKIDFFFSIAFRSGTGKTTLLKKLLDHSFPKKKRKSKFYFINVGAEELSGYKKSYPESQSIGFGGLDKTAKHSGIVIEDIIHMEKKDEKHMRTALNFGAHHKRQKIFSISHGIHKTSLWSMLSFFHFIIFTSATSNVPVLRYTLNYFKIDKNVVDDWILQFKLLGGGKKDFYFYFSCSEIKFYFTKNILDPESGQLIGSLGENSGGSSDDKPADLELVRKNLQNKFEKYLEGHQFKAQASAIFSIIVNCLELTLIREHDLTVCFASLEGEKNKRLSLVDYISFLLSPEIKPSSGLIFLHEYIKKYCLIPNIFVKNNYFALSKGLELKKK